MDDVLRGTVALVTGASSGIGRAAALALAGRGATVALTARRGDRLTELAAQIEAGGGSALVLPADIADEAEAARVVERTVNELGRLDTLVNNAGLMILGYATESATADWKRMVDINLTGLMHTTHAAVPHLVNAAADGRRQVCDIVNVSSVAGRQAAATATVYCATKFGVVAFSEALRQELARQHVRVSLVEPGAVDTELRGHNSPEMQEALGRMFGGIERLEAQDIADAIVYIVTRPRRVAVAEMLVRPTEQV
ncbi:MULTISPECIES: SDR family NAD(P)-dependent oxidoreductase [unclassified Streptomyces]|uniref:SDR family NAD(P)-dependent oxidoreductase n=1 Tax=unclassified Streptomyces TaxID=2593676 RepID=UPI0006B20358|nr:MULTISPECIES: SDR family NAD(P)-dependent oxidoreductase [unclassified Streptomyces]KOY59406.1 oxidoreductase [Streptomyces sp. XY332]TDU78620.1 NADP-dependent 3-hydroxy acid dehydrogenase YdfG [Streptomyces sp. KS 21]